MGGAAAYYSQRARTQSLRASILLGFPEYTRPELFELAQKFRRYADVLQMEAMEEKAEQAAFENPSGSADSPFQIR